MIKIILFKWGRVFLSNAKENFLQMFLRNEIGNGVQWFVVFNNYTCKIWFSWLYDIFYCNHFDVILSFYTLNLLYAYSKTNVILEVSHKRNYCFSVVLRVFRRGIMHGHKRFCEKRHIHIILFRILSNKEWMDITKYQ